MKNEDLISELEKTASELEDIAKVEKNASEKSTTSYSDFLASVVKELEL